MLGLLRIGAAVKPIGFCEAYIKKLVILVTCLLLFERIAVKFATDVARVPVCCR